MNIALVGSNFSLRGYLPAINKIKKLKLKIICSRDKSKISKHILKKVDHENDWKKVFVNNDDKVYIFNGSLRYKLLVILAGIKSVYQYPLFTSKDIIFQTAKVFTEPLGGKI